MVQRVAQVFLLADMSNDLTISEANVVRRKNIGFGTGLEMRDN